MTVENFTEKYNSILVRVLSFSEKARREGLLALEDEINDEKYYQRDIFELGIRLVVDGTDATIIDKILTNIINIETDNEEKTLKIIQEEAVLRIQSGENSRLLELLLSSYVNIGIEDALKNYYEI